MHVKRVCVSLKHLLLCFPAGAWARGRGRAPCSSGGFGWDCGHCPCHPDPAGSRRAQPRWAVSEHSCLLHSSQPAAASCRTATVPAVTAAVKSQGSGEGSLIEQIPVSRFSSIMRHPSQKHHSQQSPLPARLFGSSVLRLSGVSHSF